MSGLLSYPSGWTLDIPAGTMFIRADVAMHTRPGAGGFCAIIEARDLNETILIRGGEPESSTDRMIQILAARLAEEIAGNRALIVTRNTLIQEALAQTFHGFNLIRMLGNAPAAVADATRHAHVMAERCRHLREPSEDVLRIAKYEAIAEEFSENQDVRFVHQAMQKLIKAVGVGSLRNPIVQAAAQDVLDAAEKERLAYQLSALRNLTSNDIPKPTREKEI